jgi:hypothetical protein
MVLITKHAVLWHIDYFSKKLEEYNKIKGIMAESRPGQSLESEIMSELTNFYMKDKAASALIEDLRDKAAVLKKNCEDSLAHLSSEEHVLKEFNEENMRNKIPQMDYKRLKVVLRDMWTLSTSIDKIKLTLTAIMQACDEVLKDERWIIPRFPILMTTIISKLNTYKKTSEEFVRIAKTYSSTFDIIKGAIEYQKQELQANLSALASEEEQLELFKSNLSTWM